MFAIAVAAALDGAAAYQVHRPAKQFRQILLHLRPIKQRWMRIRSQRRQQIYVAFIPEIVAQSRAEQFQPGDATLSAEPA